VDVDGDHAEKGKGNRKKWQRRRKEEGGRWEEEAGMNKEEGCRKVGTKKKDAGKRKAA